jgi:hypothetical protein
MRNRAPQRAQRGKAVSIEVVTLAAILILAGAIGLLSTREAHLAEIGTAADDVTRATPAPYVEQTSQPSEAVRESPDTRSGESADEEVEELPYSVVPALVTAAG